MARISKEKQVEIKNAIKQVAKEKFDTLGYEKTSTKQIAKEVDIAEGTLFNYFDSKTELFFEVFGDYYQTFLDENVDTIPPSENVSEVLLSHFQKLYSFVLKMPRGVMSEIAIASVRMAKKHPNRFKKFVQIDFDFMNGITIYIKRLVDTGILQPIDENQMGQIIFSAIAYELLMYVYDHNITKEMFYNNIKKKIDILVKGYLTGGSK